jgi:hypothetical protein
MATLFPLPPPQAHSTIGVAQTYGRLTEGIHLAGYTFERACTHLEWLLDGDRWKGCGDFADVNAFLDSVRLDQFRTVAETRKRIAERIKALQPAASNRQIARTLGVAPATVNRDVASNEAGAKEITRKTASRVNDTASNEAPATLTGEEAARAAQKAANKAAVADPAAQRGQPLRDGPDFWPTPDSLIRAAVEHMKPALPRGPIWECACGDGRLGRGIGADVMTDKYPQDGSDPLDFLVDDPPVPGLIAFTNQPFNAADEFLARGLALLDARLIQGLVLLLRHDHFMASGKVEALNRATLEVHCNWRPTWIPDTEGSPRWAFAWVCWGASKRLPPLYIREVREDEE